MSGFLDKAKDALEDVKDKAEELAGKAKDEAGELIDKVRHKDDDEGSGDAGGGAPA
jgi:hypothetical protein